MIESFVNFSDVLRSIQKSWKLFAAFNNFFTNYRNVYESFMSKTFKKTFKIQKALKVLKRFLNHLKLFTFSEKFVIVFKEVNKLSRMKFRCQKNFLMNQESSCALCNCLKPLGGKGSILELV